MAGVLLAGGMAAARSEPVARPLGAGAPVVRLYIPFSAGGGADAAGRNLLRTVSRLNGQAVETVYLTAESGAAAGRAVHAAPPDGRTLLLARVGSNAIQPALSPRRGLPLSEFTVLAVLDQTPLICVVRAGSPIQSMRELQAALAAQPGKLRYSTAGAGTLQNLAVRYLLSLSGLPDDAARPVHVDQGPRATQALLDGEADFSCNTARSVLKQLQAGTLRGLMTTAQGRLKALPRLQNAAELGLRDMQNLQGWSALLGPPGMSPAAVAQWRALLTQVAEDAEWQAATEATGAAPRIRALRDPAAYLSQQQQFYERLVTLLGAPP
ncbi:tripartite tricarboxylate transporter substrate-binding protein [Roseateles sp. LYH14W]|uniref:Tripartite tricarboxylate transporter substrate-binding protein n=1 Tax=Pelomonas parva TaxID=3299032 RepID=A0ABW7F0I7_9BURK